MTAITLSDQKNHHQQANSLRKKDKLWIYKNRQGLMILEDELNERRKKRFARQRTSPPVKELVTKEIENIMKSESIPVSSLNSSIPDDAILPIAKKVPQETASSSKESEPPIQQFSQKDSAKNVQESTADKPIQAQTITKNADHKIENQLDQKSSKEKIGKLNVDKFLPKEQTTLEKNDDKSTKRSLISERSKLFQQELDIAPKSTFSEKEIVPESSISRKEVMPKAFVQKSDIDRKLSLAPKVLPKLSVSTMFKKEDPFALLSQKKEITPKASVSTIPKKDIIPKAFLFESSRSETFPKKEITPRPSVSKKTDVDTFKNKDESLKSPVTSLKDPVDISPKKTQRSPFSTPTQNFLADAKMKLSSIQHKPAKVKSIVTSETNVKRTGLVSSFISALETPSSLNEKKVTGFKQIDDIFPRSTSPTSKGAPLKPPRHHLQIPNSDINPVAQTPPNTPPLSEPHSSTKSNIFSDVKRKQIPFEFPPKHVFDRRASMPVQSPPQNQLERIPISQTDSLNNDSTINVYLPRLSPDISFNDQLTVHDDLDGRPIIKKRVSFSEELTYIPDEKSFSDTLFSETKQELNQERSVNTAPPEEPFTPATAKKIPEPQKISMKLLDMFQQKVQPKLVKTSPQPLIHLTKTRPRKPPSLKKPTYPAATAQPHWRERATNKKYEFVV